MTWCVYIGNHAPPHSTEVHVARALEANDVTVVRLQEQRARHWDALARDLAVPSLRPDFVLWTRTGDLARQVGHERQRALLEAAREASVPVVGLHLDKWLGLDREHLIMEEPYFEVDLLLTADGSEPDAWEQYGVNHMWLPPGVSEAECAPGTHREELASDLVFVGSWHGYGHHEDSPHRMQLVEFLRDTYGERVAFWPKEGEHAVRGERLRDLYASCKVAVGDSCLVGKTRNYWSDRVPESIGRGICLVHPWIDGMQGHYTPGLHFLTWVPGRWDMARATIDAALSNDEWRHQIAEEGRRHVLATATYEVRARTLLRLVADMKEAVAA